MLDITNDTVKKLGSKLNLTNDEERTTVYSAVAVAYSNVIVDELIKENITSVDSQTMYKINDLYYALNEISVLDKNEFTSIVRSFINFRIDRSYNTQFGKSFTEIMNIDKHIGKGIMETIDANITLFNTTVLYAKEVVENIEGL